MIWASWESKCGCGTEERPLAIPARRSLPELARQVRRRSCCRRSERAVANRERGRREGRPTPQRLASALQPVSESPHLLLRQPEPARATKWFFAGISRSEEHGTAGQSKKNQKNLKRTRLNPLLSRDGLKNELGTNSAKSFRINKRWQKRTGNELERTHLSAL